MPKFDNQLYNSIATQKKDATNVYMPERINAMDAPHSYTVVGGEKISNDNINAQRGTLSELPYNYMEDMARKDAILEAIGWQDKAGKPGMTQGLAKTVGASAAIAVGAGYMAPVTTLAGLGTDLIAGAIGMEGFTLLEGRPATLNELTVGASVQMALPLAGAAIQKAGQTVLYANSQPAAKAVYSEIGATKVSSDQLTWAQKRQFDLRAAKRKASEVGTDIVQPVKNVFQDFKNQRTFLKEIGRKPSFYDMFELGNSETMPIYNNYMHTAGKRWEIISEDLQYAFKSKHREAARETFEHTHRAGAYKKPSPRVLERLDKITNTPAFEGTRTIQEVPVSSKAKITEDLLERATDGERLRPYFGWRLHDQSPYNFRSSYKTVGEFRDAIKSGEFKIHPSFREELGMVIREQEAKYAAKASGSAVLARDGYINKFPGDIDLYQSKPGVGKHIYTPDDRHITNTAIDQIQMQTNAYNNPAEYLRANKEAFLESMRTGTTVQPKYKFSDVTELDPIRSSIMDAFMSPKPKHMGRVDELFGTVPIEELSGYVKLRRTILGHENMAIPKFDWSDVNSNMNILERFRFTGNTKQLAMSPEKMQLYFDHMYTNVMLGSRQIEPYVGGKSAKSIEEYILTHTGVGERAYGEGTYVQTSQYMNYGEMEAIVQPKLKTKIEHPLDILKPHRELFAGYASGNEGDILVLTGEDAVESYGAFVNDGSNFRFRPYGKIDLSKKSRVNLDNSFQIEKARTEYKYNYTSPGIKEKYAELHKSRYPNSIYKYHDELALLEKRERMLSKLERGKHSFESGDNIYSDKGGYYDRYKATLRDVNKRILVNNFTTITSGVGVTGVTAVRVGVERINRNTDKRVREQMQKYAESRGITVDEAYQEMEELGKEREKQREERKKLRKEGLRKRDEERKKGN